MSCCPVWQFVLMDGSCQSAGWGWGQVEFGRCFVLLLSQRADGVYILFKSHEKLFWSGFALNLALTGTA